ncbi:hypothetical protein LTR56_014835 [Elasticomyces elasticus]|nr:hypothetical protein LTR56_014835 [Elasticomyces elasticus]KAK3644706.1 hypothetical protein LTR22_015081 [Elasticomyces elasticus]KAK5755170.1 hypothetical protein LTS12_014734 [Elasticomyces elasticus]
MKASMFLLYAALCAARAVVPTNSSAGINCYNFKLDVPVTATKYVLDILPVNNNIDAVNFALDIDGRTSLNATERILGNVTISESFTLKATICTPSAENDKHIMQLLTHGLIVDSRYWDIEIDRTNHSYVLAAVNAGYTVLSYDRLGHGQSEKPDASVVQGPVELELLRVLTEMARDGSLIAGASPISPSALPSGFPAFEHVVHVGHSYGSILTAALLVAYPELSSAAILTGFTVTNSTNPTTSTAALGFEYAAANDLGRYGDRGSGYIVPATVDQIQLGFYHRDNISDLSGFSDALLAYGEYIKQPLTTGEWLSIRGLLNIVPALEFKGPLQFFLAERDFLVCGSDCKSDYDPAVLAALYPRVKSLDTYIQPDAGHGLTFQKNATAGYAVMMNWLDSQGF